MIFPLQEGSVTQTGEFKQSLDSFYVTDSPLSVTNIAEMQYFIQTDQPLWISH